MMHLDMKMENILVDSNFNLKISDFGHAMFYQ
jgi:serine/threonine protein kinase